VDQTAAPSPAYGGTQAIGLIAKEHAMSILMLSFIVALVIIATLFSYAALIEGWRLFRGDGRLRLTEAAHAQGLALPALDSERAVRDAARATRRCLSCTAQARCDEVLAARDWKALREICPNNAYIDHLRTI
jgi:hypothetical protein